MKSNSALLYVKITLYGGLLVGIILIMRYVRGPDFTETAEVLMGSPSDFKLYNWCPKDIQAIHFLPEDKTILGESVRSFCSISYSSYNAQEVANLKWIIGFKALDNKGNEVILEIDSEYNFVRGGALIYKVPELKKRLAELE